MRVALRRLIQLVVVLIFVSFFSFSLISLVPGDPVVAIVGFASPAQLAQVRHQIGLDDPFLLQYVHWLGGFVHGDLGQVYSGPTGRSAVSTGIAQSLPVTLELMAYAMILTVLIAIPLGILSAYRSGTVTDKVISMGAFGSIAMPDFALAMRKARLAPKSVGRVRTRLFGGGEKWAPGAGKTLKPEVEGPKVRKRKPEAGRRKPL